MDVDDRLFERSLRRHGLVVDDDLGRVGMSSRQWCRRVDRGWWVPEAPRVWRHRSTPPSWRLSARAGLLWLGDDAALFGRAAAAWWGIDTRAPVDVELVVPRRRRSVDGPFVVHTTTAWDRAAIRRVDGARVTEPARTIIDMAASERSARSLESAIDEAIRQRVITEARLRRGLDRLGGSGRSGTALLRAMLLDTGGESFLERRFLRLVRIAELPRPRCQVVHRSNGDHIARVDFLFPGTDVVVEVTGRLGHASDAERRRDARRRNDLQQMGLMVLEFTTVDVVDDGDRVVATLRAALPP
ncbi:MAG: DUF559 domain-containing protein, partial [Ilumatobacteraceae bacterium]